MRFHRQFVPTFQVVNENILRYRPKGVVGKGVGNSRNASEMRQKCVKMGLVLLGKEERSKMRQKSVNVSKMHQKCAEHLGGEHLLDDTKFFLKIRNIWNYGI